jgi:hypothetical protein
MDGKIKGKGTHNLRGPGINKIIRLASIARSKAVYSL